MTATLLTNGITAGFSRQASSISLAWRPGKTPLLAQVYIDWINYNDWRNYQGGGWSLSARTRAWVLWLLRVDDGQLRFTGGYLGAQGRPGEPGRLMTGQPETCVWHPSGDYLVVGCGPRADEDYADTDARRLRVFGVTPDDTSQGGWQIGAETWSDPGVWGPNRDGNLAFNTTGQWLAIANTMGGFNGLAEFTGGQLRPASTFGTAVSVAWHPTDADLLAVAGQYGDLSVLRRHGDTLTATAGSPIGAVSVAWHPSGDWLVCTTLNDNGELTPVAYSWPGLQQLQRLDAFTGAVSIGFDPGGSMLAGGFAMTGGSCADPYLNATGLVVAQVTATTATTIMRPAVEDNLPAGGLPVAWHRDATGLYLAAGMYPWGVAGLDETDTFPYGFTEPGVIAWRWPVATSRLEQKQPDGSFTVVGVEGRPVSMAMPDGGLRTWPGSDQPLEQMQPDGSWARVIG